jgi:hypothetical protein
MLYNKHLYINRNIPCIIGKKIYYYDIEDAGVSILSNLLNNSDLNLHQINTLQGKSKHERHVEIGRLMDENPYLTKLKNDGLVSARQAFVECNNIEDEDILTIKHDAVYVIDKPAGVTEFKMENMRRKIRFRLKEIYSSYWYYPETDKETEIEIYFKNGIGGNYTVHIKGLGDIQNDFIQELAKLYSFIENNFDRRNSKRIIAEHIREYREKYIRKELPVSIYKELNQKNKWRLKYEFDDYDTRSNTVPNIENIDVSFNYVRYIIPLLKITL